VTTGRSLIVLLDNAASAGQVRAVLPGDGPSLVVVTTRWRLGVLAIDGAHFTELGPLAEDDALDLLDRIAGPGRASAEPDAARTVVRMCGHLPLAVCVSAARLAPNPRWPVKRIAAELASERDRREEVGTLQQEAEDQQVLTEQQGKLLEVQAGQLDVQRQQLDDQREINQKQAEVAALQAQELRESLDERKREAGGRRRAQASRVFIHEERLDTDPSVSQVERAVRGEQPQPVVVAYVMNTSQQPVYNVLISWHLGTAPKGQYPLMPLMPGAEDKDTRPVPPDAKPEMFASSPSSATHPE
jgi:hypothetical protein